MLIVHNYKINTLIEAAIAALSYIIWNWAYAELGKKQNKLERVRPENLRNLRTKILDLFVRKSGHI